ncbi:F-box only protein 48 [Arvicanthis niloticus]|uniref:F-box only protein 48 n=1 Tax=Arvicanthis niloticus TaxID=61156 RepID=UPI001486E28D|nr:F-box only protein 48 [Arvicanthis niloticus]
MKKTSKKNNNFKVPGMELNSTDAERGKKESPSNFVEMLPLEVTSKIFSQLDIRSLCRASRTCTSWNHAIRNNDSLWKPHCLTIRAVCQREIDDGIKKGYTWREILLENYQKSKVKHGWLSGRYSNIRSPVSLPEEAMCPMDADTWGEILDAELEREV